MATSFSILRTSGPELDPGGGGGGGTTYTYSVSGNVVDMAYDNDLSGIKVEMTGSNVYDYDYTDSNGDYFLSVSTSQSAIDVDIVTSDTNYISKSQSLSLDEGDDASNVNFEIPEVQFELVNGIPHSPVVEMAGENGVQIVMTLKFDDGEGLGGEFNVNQPDFTANMLMDVESVYSSFPNLCNSGDDPNPNSEFIDAAGLAFRFKEAGNSGYEDLIGSNAEAIEMYWHDADETPYETFEHLLSAATIFGDYGLGAKAILLSDVLNPEDKTNTGVTSEPSVPGWDEAFEFYLDPQGLDDGGVNNPEFNYAGQFDYNFGYTEISYEIEVSLLGFIKQHCDNSAGTGSDYVSQATYISAFTQVFKIHRM